MQPLFSARLLRRSAFALRPISYLTFSVLVMVVGRVVDRTTGQPLTGVEISLRSAASGAAQGSAARTNGAGEYTMRGVAPGHYTITLDSDDVPPQTSEVVVHAGKPQHFNLTACSTTLDYTCAAAVP